MGVTLACKKTGSYIDVGYGGFNRLRNKVAMLCNEEFGRHYKTLDNAFGLPFEERNAFYEQFDKTTLQMMESKKVSIKLVDFCLQSDCCGSIQYGACGMIYNAIKDYDDEIIYGYAGRKNPARFADFKVLLKECYENKSKLEWY